MTLKRAPLPALWYGTIAATPVMKCKAGGITWVFACPGQALISACRVQGLVRIWTKCFNEYGLEDIDTAVEETLKTLNYLAPCWYGTFAASFLCDFSFSGRSLRLAMLRDFALMLNRQSPCRVANYTFFVTSQTRQSRPSSVAWC